MSFTLSSISCILVVIISFIAGFFLNHFFPSYFSKKGENLATKEDVGKITQEIESVKNIFKDQYDLSKTEREFYNRMIEIIYKFGAEIKKYEFDHKVSVTTELALRDQLLQQKYLEFFDSANEFVGKSYVFLNEEKYKNLKEALDTSASFADLTNNLLYAMRKSLYPHTELKPRDSLKEFKY